MATNSTWTVVMDDKKIINQTVKMKMVLEQLTKF